jgi:hypothetical protein
VSAIPRCERTCSGWPPTGQAPPKRNFHENRRKDEFREREHLAQADWHIAEAKAHIARQKDTIAELKRDGHETKVAMLMLNALKHTLCAFEQHREVILVRLRNG